MTETGQQVMNIKSEEITSYETDRNQVKGSRFWFI